MEQRACVLVSHLETKVNLVREQKTRLDAVLDTYVDKVTEKAQEAIKSGVQDMSSIREMSTKMESTLEFLLDLSMKIEAGPSAKVSEDQALPSSSVLLSSTSPPVANTQHRQLHDLESAEIIELQNRVKTVEAAIAMCRLDTSQSTAQHNDEIKDQKILYHTLEERLGKYENIISELKEEQSTACGENAERMKKLEASNTDQGKRLKTTEHQLQDFERIRTASEKEQDKKLSDVEGQIKQVQKDIVKKIKGIEAGMVGDIQQKLNQITETHTKVQEKQDERFNEMESELNELQSQQADLMKRVRSKKEAMGKRITDLENKVANGQSSLSQLNSVEEQLEQLTSNLTAVEENVQEDIKQLKETSAELTSKMGLFASNEDLCDVMKTSMTLSKSVDGLTSKVEAAEVFREGSASYREKEENKRRELEDRILVVEENRRKDLEHYVKKLEEVDSQYKQVCQIVDNRVTPLRRLQRLLHEYHQSVEKREELSSRLDTVMEQMDKMKAKVDDLATTGQHDSIGFTAYFPSIKPVEKDKVVTDFSDVLLNIGKHYSPVTGYFTAPCDGVFITSITLRQEGEGKVDVHILRSRSGKTARSLCKAVTYTDKASSCGVAVVRLMAGDELYVKIKSLKGEVKLSQYSSFTCVKVG